MEKISINQIWGDKPSYRLFISHKAEDKLLASKLKDNLKSFDVSCFVAHQDIFPSKEWQIEIENALFSADGLIALLTEKFNESDWTGQEIGFAYAREIPIVPIRLGKDPYGFIGKYQGLNCDLENEFHKIISILLGQDSRMVEHFITLVEKSDSYDRSNKLSTFLANIENLNNEQVDRLIVAFKANTQVKSSIGFRGEKDYNGHIYSKGLYYELNRITGKDYQEKTIK